MIQYASSSISFACVGMKDSPDVDVVTATATAIQDSSDIQWEASICDGIVLTGKLPMQ